MIRSIKSMKTSEVFEVRYKLKETSKAKCYQVHGNKELWIPNKAIASNSTRDRLILKSWFTPRYA